MASVLSYDTFVRHMVNFVVATGMLFVIDHFGIKPFVRRCLTKDKEVRQAHWFFTHAVANLFVVLTGAHALGIMFVDPAYAMDSRNYSDTSLFGNASSWPLTFINAVHVYHMIGGFHLTSADYFHHFMFVPALGIPGRTRSHPAPCPRARTPCLDVRPPRTQPTPSSAHAPAASRLAEMLLWGAVEPGGACFISGLPGGISYFMLGLLKIGAIESMTEKRITANLNCWLRVPGILVSSFIVYQAVLYGRHTLPLWPAVLHVVLPVYNALYYCKQAVANYTVHCARRHSSCARVRARAAISNLGVW